MPIHHAGTPQPFEVDGREFTWTDIGDGGLEIASADTRFWFQDGGNHVLVHGDDFPESLGTETLMIELHPMDLLIRTMFDVAEGIVRQCLGGNYTVLGRGKRRR